MKQGKTFVIGDIKILIDDDDFNLVCGKSWWLKNGLYPATTIGGKKIYLHRLILGEGDYVTDHINQNTFDNRRCNLRKSNKSKNAMNKPCRGIRKLHNKWQAYITMDGKQKHLGMFKTEEEALRARRLAEKKYFGEFAFNY